MKKAAVIVFLLLAGFLWACDLGDEDDPGDGKIACQNAQTKLDVERELLLLWTLEDNAGTNSFYVWEIDRQGGFLQEEKYYFKATGEETGNSVPEKNWEAPEPTFWWAARNGPDGYEPRIFTEDNPFIYGYLPFDGEPSWVSKSGAVNDGTCPENNIDIDKRKRCVGQSQLDPDSPDSPDLTVSYLVRFLYIVPSEDGGNSVKACFQKAISF